MTARELEKMGKSSHHGMMKLPVDIKEDNANDPRAVAVQSCSVVAGHVPKSCSLASSIDKGS